MFIFFCQVSVEVFCSFLIGWSVFLLFIPVLYIFLMLSVLSNIHIAKIFQQSDLSFGFTAAAAAAESLQSCPTLCDPIGDSPPGSPLPGILQARTLEWVAISFSSAWKWKVKVKSLSRVQLFSTPWTAAYQAPPCMGFSRQECWSGVPSQCHQELFPLPKIYSSAPQGSPTGKEHLFSCERPWQEGIFKQRAGISKLFSVKGQGINILGLAIQSQTQLLSSVGETICK